MILNKEFRNRIYTIMLSMILDTIADRQDNDNKFTRCKGFCAYLTNATNATGIEGINEYTHINVNTMESIDIDIPSISETDWKYIDCIKLYPELMKHDPRDRVYWFERDDEGAAKRVAILKEAIELTSILDLDFKCPNCESKDLTITPLNHVTCNKCGHTDY